MKFTIILSLLFLCSSALAGGYYNDRARGWYWYEVEPEIIESPEEDAEAEISRPIVSSPLTPKEVIDKQRIEFENALASAVVNPTPENLQNYLAATKLISMQADKFSKSFKTSIWTKPEYDYSIYGRPTSAQALVAYNQEKVATNDEILFDIAGKKGLIYFFRSDCPYCHRFSPIMKKVAEVFGFTVIPISLDGQGTKDYPSPRSNHYLTDKLNVEVVPALFMVDPDSNEVATVGYGYSDWSQLIAKLIFADKSMSTTSSEVAIND